MKKVFDEIWELALPYQDFRDDKGHARIVTDFAIKLVKIIDDVNEDIVIPAAILHDIGWSQLTEKERFSIFDSNITRREELAVRIKHQEEGVKLARRILEKVNYNKELVGPILEIISQHDTREGFFSKEDGIMRDADKLWRFSKIGFNADARRAKIDHKDLYNRYVKRIEDDGFLYSKEAKRIAKNELNKRKEEFS